MLERGEWKPVKGQAGGRDEGGVVRSNSSSHSSGLGDRGGEGDPFLSVIASGVVKRGRRSDGNMGGEGKGEMYKRSGFYT